MQVRQTLRQMLHRGHLGGMLLAILLCGTGLTLFAIWALRGYAIHNAELVARAISYTVEAAVVFDDEAAARETLDSIARHEEIAMVRIRLPDGRLFTRWEHGQSQGDLGIERWFSRRLMPELIRVPVESNGRSIATVELTANGHTLLQFVMGVVLAVVACLLLSLQGAYWLTRHTLSRIMTPLRHLVSVLHRVRVEQDFTPRLPGSEIAELNALNEDVNALLGELERWQQWHEEVQADLRHQATHDPLTGLANRALFEERLTQSLLLCQRQQAPLGLLYIDCNLFKPINDTYGHAAGDAVLVAIAARLRVQLPPSALASRLGGDEFALLLPYFDEVALKQRIKMLHKGMEQPIALPDGQTLLATLSIGHSHCPPWDLDAERLMQQADEEMYRAKQEARAFDDVNEDEVRR